MKNILKFSFIILALLIISCGKDDSGPSFNCNDGIQNGTETGVDCGGDCPPCPTCNDGIQNGNETGVDCGGDCPPCYGVGLPGQAGGIIFYDKGSFSDGWQYLEVAPANLKFGAWWDCFGTSTLAREEGLGKGDVNLETVRGFDCFDKTFHPSLPPVMLQSDDFSSNGFADWYLPSLGELSVLYTEKNIIGGWSDSRYWSSTETVDQNVKAVDFRSGEVKIIPKQSLSVAGRAIRKF